MQIKKINKNCAENLMLASILNQCLDCGDKVRSPTPIIAGNLQTTTNKIILNNRHINTVNGATINNTLINLR